MDNKLTEYDWNVLLQRVHDGKCTPFLGAGACYGFLPTGSVIAEKWAKEFDYPNPDHSDLAQVAQFVAVKHKDAIFPKDLLLRTWFRSIVPPDLTKNNEPHSILAGLPFPVFITTNYDDTLARALLVKDKEPMTDVCRWNSFLQGTHLNISYRVDEEEPTEERPSIFYLHGHMDESQSIVLTEDDYFDFLVNISRDESLIPARIQESLAYTSLLFIGYSLKDWDFRVLFRGLVTQKEKSLRRLSIAVQLSETDAPEYRTYMNQYFDEMNIKVYWGTAREFATELYQRWSEFSIE